MGSVVPNHIRKGGTRPRGGAAGLLAWAICTVGIATMVPIVPALVAPALGQPRLDGDYQGVTPGRNNRAPRQPAAGTRRVVTWPGFQKLESGGSRFFLQVNGSVETEMSRSDNQIRITLKNARVHLINNHRPLVTTYFNTPVNSARLIHRRRDVVLVLTMRAESTPTITTQPGENGFQFVFVDFPAGQYGNLI